MNTADFPTFDDARRSSADLLVQALRLHMEDLAAAGAPEERSITHRLAEVLAAEADEAASIEVLTDWLGRHPEDDETLHRLFNVEQARGNHQAICFLGTQIVEKSQGPAQIEAANAVGAAARALGAPGMAVDALEIALASNPTEAALRSALAAVYQDAGDFGNHARMLLLEADTTTGDEKVALVKQAAESLIHKSDLASLAVDPLRELLASREDDQELLILLGDALIATGELDEAVAIINNAIETSKRKRTPQYALLQHRMSRIAGISGETQTQIEWLNAAFTTDKSNGTIAAELAEAALAVGDDETAMSALKAITLLKTPGPMSKAVAFLRQAQIAHKQGDTQKAILWARRAKMEDATLAEAQEFLVFIGDVH